MNIHEAITSYKPFTNKSMIGAWMLIDGYLVHRDNTSDFKDMGWIKANCLIGKPFHELQWFTVLDLTRTDWRVID